MVKNILVSLNRSAYTMLCIPNNSLESRIILREMAVNKSGNVKNTIVTTQKIIDVSFFISAKLFLPWSYQIKLLKRSCSVSQCSTTSYSYKHILCQSANFPQAWHHLQQSALKYTKVSLHKIVTNFGASFLGPSRDRYMYNVST